MRLLGLLLVIGPVYYVITRPDTVENLAVLVPLVLLGLYLVLRPRGRRRGRNWQRCTNCRGVGWFSGVRGSYITCGTCHGHRGWYLERRFPVR
jgi:hypothetical protein